jgi:hypothetical protein
LTKPAPADIVDTILFYAGHPDMYPILAGTTFTARLSLAMAIFIGILFVAFLIKYIEFRISGHPLDLIDRKTHLMVFVLLAVTLLPYIISHVLVPMYVPRYTIAGGIVMYLLVGHAIDKIDTTTVQYLVIGFLLLGMAGNLAVYTSGDSIEQWDDAAAWTEDASDSIDLVIMNPYWISDIFSYYYGSSSAQVVQYPAADNTPSEGDQDYLRSLVETNETVMLVSWGYDSKESMRGVLRETHTLQDRERFGIIEVYHYERSDDSVENRTRANQSLSSSHLPPGNPTMSEPMHESLPRGQSHGG